MKSPLYRVKFKTKRFFKKRLKTFLTAMAATILLFAVSLVFFPPLKSWIWGMFVVDKISVEGVQYYDPEDVLKALSMFKGKVNWEIDRDYVKTVLKKRFKWIESVSVSNFPSSTLVVIVKEQKPLAFYKDKFGELWIMGKNGEVITRFKSRKFGYLYLPIVSCKKRDIPYVAERLGLYRRTGKYQDFFLKISEIVVRDKDEKWTVYLNDFNAKIYLDPFGSFKNVEVFEKIKSHLATNYEKIDYVDLSFNKQIIVKPSI